MLKTLHPVFGSVSLAQICCTFMSAVNLYQWRSSTYGADGVRSNARGIATCRRCGYWWRADLRWYLRHTYDIPNKIGNEWYVDKMHDHLDKPQRRPDWRTLTGLVDGQEGRSNNMDFWIPNGLDNMSLLSHPAAVFGNVDDGDRYPCLCPAIPSLAVHR